MSDPTLVSATTPQQPSIFDRLTGVYRALDGFVYLLAYGVYGGLVRHLKRWIHGNGPLITFHAQAWRRAITANGLPILLEGSDQAYAAYKRDLIGPYAYGKVLEVGAGTGMTLKYYDASRVSEIVAVEPSDELHDLLHQSVAALPELTDKVRVINAMVGDVEGFHRQGITEGSIDTVCLVQVLCSVSDPQKQIRHLARYLKSGGQVLLFEHVHSSDRITSLLQRIFEPVWTPLAGNCHLTRDPVSFFRQETGWTIQRYDRPAVENGGGLYPHVVARIVKQ